METVAVIFGLLTIVGTVYLLIKRVETRLVLLSTGFLMCIAGFIMGLEGASPLVAFGSFATGMTNASFIQSICSSLGFAMVLQVTQCDKHLIYALANIVSRARWLLIPGAALATFAVNNAIPSAAGCAAAVGVIMIPLLMSQGVHPATAASSVMLGTIGSNLSVGNPHNPNIAEIVNAVMGANTITDTGVIMAHAPAVIASIIIGIGWLIFRAWKTGENKGYVYEGAKLEHDTFRINPILAILPLVPIVLLITFSFDVVRGNPDKGIEAMIPWAAKFGVPYAMLFGSFLCVVFGMLFNKINPQEASKKFFEGAGKGYGDVIGLILSAGVFVAGMKSLGMIDAFLKAMEHSDSIVMFASTYGPFLLGVASGSGDAATLAFNGAVTPHAMDFGVAINKMGSVAAITGSLGRTMSPLAAAALICAGIAKVDPLEIAKRNAPGMIAASVATMLIMFYVV